jgi:hypothetical protein
MKKAKIMLSAIAAIALVSGTLAFRTHYKGIARLYYYCLTTNGSATGTCNTAFTIAVSVATTNLPGYIQFTTFGTFATNTTACTTIIAPVQFQCNNPLYCSVPRQ